MRRVNPPPSEKEKNMVMLLCACVCACVCQKHLSMIESVSRPSGSLLCGHLDGGKDRIKEQCVCERQTHTHTEPETTSWSFSSGSVKSA